MAIKRIGGFIVRSVVASIAVNGVRRVIQKIPIPKGSSSVLKYDNGRISLSGDKISSRSVRDIEKVLSSRGCKSGTITLKKDGRVAFSGIPESCHQRIRNLLLL